MASSPRPLIPPPGNAARPVFFLLAGFFGLMLVGYPIFMHVLGLSTAGIVWITLLILAVGVGILWFTVRLGQSLEQDAQRLESGQVWAEWTVPADLHRRFVFTERRGTNRRALAYAAGGPTFGLVLALVQDDWLLGGIVIAVFLLAAAIIYVLAGPPRGAGSDAARRVRIGPHGVHTLGRYMPFSTTMVRLRRVEIDDGVPAVMRFTVKAGRRVDEIRVPLPPGYASEAEALAERIRREHDL